MSKVVLITGASSGIGSACAEYLTQKGYIVYGTSRKAEAANDKYRPLQMDVTSRQSIQAGIELIISEQGKIDAVVNNAGMGIFGSLELATEEEIRMQMETNFYGVAYMCSAVIPYMRDRKSGTIINISSIGGVAGLPFQGFYSSSKFAVEGYSEALSIETRRFGIHVVVIEPGDFHTNFVHNRLVSEATANHPAYTPAYANALAMVNKEELSGSKPIRIAKLMHQIINKKKPRFRYRIGKLEQILMVYLKRIIPSGWHLKILSKFYKV